MADVVIEPQPDGYPFIGRTGKGDMRSTREVGQLILRGGVRHAFVEIETYKLLLDAAIELDELRNAERTKDP